MFAKILVEERLINRVDAVRLNLTFSEVDNAKLVDYKGKLVYNLHDFYKIKNESAFKDEASGKWLDKEGKEVPYYYLGVEPDSIINHTHFAYLDEEQFVDLDNFASNYNHKYVIVKAISTSKQLDDSFNELKQLILELKSEVKELENRLSVTSNSEVNLSKVKHQVMFKFDLTEYEVASLLDAGYELVNLMHFKPESSESGYFRYTFVGKF